MVSRGASGAIGCLSCGWTTPGRWHVSGWGICSAGASHVWSGARRKLELLLEKYSSELGTWLSPLTVLTCVVPWTACCKGASGGELPTWHFSSGADVTHLTEGYCVAQSPLLLLARRAGIASIREELTLGAGICMLSRVSYGPEPGQDTAAVPQQLWQACPGRGALGNLSSIFTCF